MRLGVLNRQNDPCSLRVYIDNCLAHLAASGVNTCSFIESEPIPPECDIVWDPSVCMRRLPEVLRSCNRPIVATIHGFKTFALPMKEIVSAEEPEEYLLAIHEAVKSDWEWFASLNIKLIAVSEYVAKETIMAFAINPRQLQVLHLGVDTQVFHSRGNFASHPRPYLLHVSASSNPIKNLNRIIAAYSNSDLLHYCDLVIIQPKTTISISIPGVHFIASCLDQNTLACWYRGAHALIFPSLRETFGLPIIEAMACGCPVITSCSTACAEVSGEAAVLVDPRSIISIRDAMLRVVKDERLRGQLRQAGYIRAREFTWKKHVDGIITVFRELTRKPGNKAMVS
jgi:glycosyltransferase involved in cell wall biosynthesis